MLLGSTLGQFKPLEEKLSVKNVPINQKRRTSLSLETFFKKTSLKNRPKVPQGNFFSNPMKNKKELDFKVLYHPEKILVESEKILFQLDLVFKKVDTSEWQKIKIIHYGPKILLSFFNFLSFVPNNIDYSASLNWQPQLGNFWM